MQSCGVSINFRVQLMGNNLQRICREAVNANLSLYFLFLGTLPLTVIPTTGHGKELIGKAQGRKGERKLSLN